MVVDTGGGRMRVRWDETAQATPHGQLVFFAEFLRASGVFDQWVEACPLVYRSGNAPAKRDVLGTLMLSILAGHRRYAHITAVRGDAVAAQAHGIAGMVSEDAVRRALKTIEAPASQASNEATLRSVIAILRESRARCIWQSRDSRDARRRPSSKRLGQPRLVSRLNHEHRCRPRRV